MITPNNLKKGASVSPKNFIMSPESNRPNAPRNNALGKATPDAMPQGNVVSEAAAAKVLWRLVKHLQHRTDVQNIDLMNLAGFCRNCLSKWYQEEMTTMGKQLDVAAAKKLIYGMDYDQWKKLYQKEAPQDLGKPTDK